MLSVKGVIYTEVPGSEGCSYRQGTTPRPVSSIENRPSWQVLIEGPPWGEAPFGASMAIEVVAAVGSSGNGSDDQARGGERVLDGVVCIALQLPTCISNSRILSKGFVFQTSQPLVVDLFETVTVIPAPIGWILNGMYQDAVVKIGLCMHKSMRAENV